MICDCIAKTAAKNDRGFHLGTGGIWVHAKCGRPTRGYLRAFLEENDMASHLHLLRNGPLHNTLLTTAEIVDRSGVALRDDAQRVLAHVAEYRWTPETVVGEVSGNTAHVWIWRDPDGA